MNATQGFLADLEAAAIAAQQEELRFRESVAAEISSRERARQFAFRRVGLVRTMTQAAAGAETEEKAVAAQRAALKRELGWVGEAEPRKKVLDAWGAVASAVWQGGPSAGEGKAGAGKSVPAALAEFEAFYLAEIGKPFFALFDHEMPVIPVVEF